MSDLAVELLPDRSAPTDAVAASYAWPATSGHSDTLRTDIVWSQARARRATAGGEGPAPGRHRGLRRGPSRAAARPGTRPRARPHRALRATRPVDHRRQGTGRRPAALADGRRLGTALRRGDVGPVRAAAAARAVDDRRHRSAVRRSRFVLRRPYPGARARDGPVPRARRHLDRRPARPAEAAAALRIAHAVEAVRPVRPPAPDDGPQPRPEDPLVAVHGDRRRRRHRVRLGPRPRARERLHEHQPAAGAVPPWRNDDPIDAPVDVPLARRPTRRAGSGPRDGGQPARRRDEGRAGRAGAGRLFTGAASARRRDGVLREINAGRPRGRCEHPVWPVRGLPRPPSRLHRRGSARRHAVRSRRHVGGRPCTSNACAGTTSTHGERSPTPTGASPSTGCWARACGRRAPTSTPSSPCAAEDSRSSHVSPSEPPPLDCHAHIAPDVTPPQVAGLRGALVRSVSPAAAKCSRSCCAADARSARAQRRDDHPPRPADGACCPVPTCPTGDQPSYTPVSAHAADRAMHAEAGQNRERRCASSPWSE